MTSPAAPAGLTPEAALDVLRHLDAELGPVDPDARAIVALRRDEGEDAVALADVTLRDNGVLQVPDDAVALVVVTAEDVAVDDQVVALQQLVCVLPDGTEVGLPRANGTAPASEDGIVAPLRPAEVADDPPLRAWRTDVTDGEDDDPPTEQLRPRDHAANTARRAFGLASLVELLPVTDLLTRAWLLSVAGEAVARFDGPGGPREVEGDELTEVAARPPLGALTADEVVPTWEQVHAAAVEGSLELGPFTVDREHAAWLDAPGLAQLLDRTLPSTEQLLASLQVVGEDELLTWAIEQLSSRSWYPTT